MIIFLVSFIVLVLVINMIDWLCHISLTKEHSIAYGTGNYEKFKKHFNQMDWELVGDGVRNWSSDSQCSNTIIKFNGNGMIIYNPIYYVMTKLYVHNFTKNHKSSVKW